MQKSLIKRLQEAGVGDDRITEVVDAGYYLREFMSTPGALPRIAVSDMFYGNKTPSSDLDVSSFISYVRGEAVFDPAPPLQRIKVKNQADIQEVLAEQSRARYIAEGSLTFRGQPREYRVRRRMPNPVRSDSQGWEVSIMPGACRQAGEYYSCAIRPTEVRSFELFSHEFEPEKGLWDVHFSYDLMRTEQHYATQTMGLDVAFDVKSALFFATHQFHWDDNGHAFYRIVDRGQHTGVIYLFRFGNPSVQRTEYLIQSFDFFRTHLPERILRQSCGLPLFGPDERNIALTEVDCVIELDADFDAQCNLTPEYMFPSIMEDSFYRKLLALKDRYPKPLAQVVEYQWARSQSM